MAYSVSSGFTLENKDTASILAGQPCAVLNSGSGLLRAIASDQSMRAVGIALEDIAPNFSGGVKAAGTVTLADWTAVIGTTLLIPSTLYYLDPFTYGQLTSIAPTTPGQIMQLVGRAVSPFDLVLSITAYILL